MDIEYNVNEILQKLESINSIYNRISEEIISSDYKTKFSETLIKYKYNFDKILKKDLPLKVCVVGTMKTGKSEFINSIIKENLLVVSDLPMTKKVTVFKYNEEFKIFKVFENKTREEISKDEHREVGNHKYKDGFKRIKSDPDNIEYFEIHYPADILKNINIADTPGFSSRYEEDDELTKRWIKKADCLIWLFDANKSADGEEGKLLKEIPLNNPKVIAVVNKMDAIEDSNKERMLNDIKNHYTFYDTIPYSALEIRKFETTVKETADKLNNILVDAKNSLLYGKTNNGNIKKGYFTIEDKRITEDLIESFKKHDLNNEYFGYKNKLKSVLREIKKDPVNIKSNVLFEKVNDVLRKESKDLIIYMKPIETIIENKIKEKSDYEKLRNEIIESTKKYLNELNAEDVVKFTFEEMLKNCFNRWNDGKPIEIDDLISNSMFRKFFNVVLDIKDKTILKEHLNIVSFNVLLIEYIRINIETIFNPIILKISAFIEQECNFNLRSPEREFNQKYSNEFFAIASFDLPPLYEEIFKGFINYIFDQYIFSNVDQIIDRNKTINNEINELLKK